MDQTYGGSIMAAVMNGGFTPEWTKRTLANLIGQNRVKQFAAPRPFAPAPTAFTKQRPLAERPGAPPPKLQTVKALAPPPTADTVAPPAARPETHDIPMAARVKAIDFQRRQQVLVSNLNLAVPKGCHLLAYNILPADFFQGELGKFLMLACEFYLHGPQNTMLLPALADGAQHFDLPKIPLTGQTQSHAEAVVQVKALRQRVLIEHQRAANAVQSGDFSRVYDRPGRQAEYRLELGNITRSLAIKLFGAAAWDTHEARFRGDLNRM
jgi:hypothetical protein